MFLCIFAVHCCCLCALLDPGGSTLLLNFQSLLVLKVGKKLLRKLIKLKKLIKKLIRTLMKVDKKLIKKVDLKKLINQLIKNDSKTPKV